MNKFKNKNDDPTSTHRIYMIDTTYITLCLIIQGIPKSLIDSLQLSDL